MKPKFASDAAIESALSSLDSESDRGAAVLGGSLVENALGQFLEHHCLSFVNRKAVDKLFGATGPLSSFSQRTLVAAAFGLIDKDCQNQLDLIREIRNHFAHHPLEASFSEDYLQGSISQLRSYTLSAIDPTLRAKGSARMAYLLTCGWLLGSLAPNAPNDSSINE